MPKATTPTAAPRQGRRHNPLEDDMVATGLLRNKPGKQKRPRADADADAGFVDSKASNKILRIGRELAEEEDAARVAAAPPAARPGFGFGYDDARLDAAAADDDDGDDAWADYGGDDDDDDDVGGAEVEVAPEDLETYQKFLPAGGDVDELLQGWDQTRPRPRAAAESRNLADLILDKIAAHEAAEARKEAGLPADDYELPSKVVEAYTKIGQILSRYKSGPLPKPFKILPTIPHWEEILDVTKPESWTPNACYQATRIFVSHKPAVVQRFLEIVLLERVREDIYETKKLNVHLFNALKKALYKPAAFFKGFLFPLVASGTCTLREAHIVSAVVARVSIPVLHSAAALKGLCDIAAQEASAGSEGGGATNMLIKTLLDKKYALPFQVVDALVFHFLRFRSVDPAGVQQGDAMAGVAAEGDVRTKLPVLWHQSLLAFAQRYKGDVTEDQREALLDLLLTHGHSAIGPEVRRELLAGRGRGVPLEAPDGAGLDGDDTMALD